MHDTGQILEGTTGHSPIFGLYDGLSLHEAECPRSRTSSGSALTPNKPGLSQVLGLDAARARLLATLRTGATAPANGAEGSLRPRRSSALLLREPTVQHVTTFLTVAFLGRACPAGPLRFPSAVPVGICLATAVPSAIALRALAVAATVKSRRRKVVGCRRSLSGGVLRDG